MPGLSRRGASAACAGCIALAVGAVGVAEGAKRGRIVADSQHISRVQATKMARSVAIDRQVPSAVFAARPPYGRVAGVSTKRLAGFPLSGRSFLILSNGDVHYADNRNRSPDTGRNSGGPTIRGARDVTIFRLNVQVPKGRNCLSIRFRFLTEEFPEFVGSEFNDGFIAEIDETTWDTNTIGSPAVTAPRNFAFDSAGRLVTVNGAGAASVTAARAKGTTYDGATRRLRASTRITPGKHRLYLSIFDQGDREFDSAVFVDRMTLTRRATCRSGVVVD